MGLKRCAQSNLYMFFLKIHHGDVDLGGHHLKIFSLPILGHLASIKQHPESEACKETSVLLKVRENIHFVTSFIRSFLSSFIHSFIHTT